MSLRLEIDGAIARILIDRADKRNAFHLEMWQALPRLLDRAEAAPDIRLIMLQSATEGMFCAGADIGELLTQHKDLAWLAANQAAINTAQYRLARSPKPTIAFIDGDCVGGGCGLAIACDMRVATPRARLGITPAKLGLVYPLHDTKLLVDLVGPGQAKKMLFTGALLPADAALAIGLIEEIADSADALAAQIIANSAHSCREIKLFVRRILEGQAQDDDASLTIFAEAFAGADFAEGVAAFTSKRKPQFP